MRLMFVLGMTLIFVTNTANAELVTIDTTTDGPNFLDNPLGNFTQVSWSVSGLTAVNTAKPTETITYDLLLTATGGGSSPFTTTGNADGVGRSSLTGGTGIDDNESVTFELTATITDDGGSANAIILFDINSVSVVDKGFSGAFQVDGTQITQFGNDTTVSGLTSGSDLDVAVLTTDNHNGNMRISQLEFTVTGIPEPTGLVLCLPIMGMALRRRRRPVAATR